MTQLRQTKAMEQTRDTAHIEHALGQAVRARLPHGLAEFVLFGLKQGWACLFGALLLGALLVSRAVWQPDWPIHRYDAMLVFALTVQVLFLVFRLETPAEAKVILLFHLTGTAMEWFKVGAGSWSYPEEAWTKVMGVPLFSGFMYASVGSYMARVIRIFRMRFAPYPPFAATLALALAIYGNFFAHHFLPDLRVGLFVATVLIFGRTRVWFTIGANPYWMPLPLAAFLTSLFLWLAENIGTMTNSWLYAGQSAGQAVSFAKVGSWYLLLYVSFVTVTLVLRRTPAFTGAATPAPQAPARA